MDRCFPSIVRKYPLLSTNVDYYAEKIAKPADGSGISAPSQCTSLTCVQNWVPYLKNHKIFQLYQQTAFKNGGKFVSKK